MVKRAGGVTMWLDVSMTDTQVPTWTLGDRLRKARESAGLKQEELAEALGLTRHPIADYENDVRAPKRAIIMAVAMRCGVPVDWLEGESPARNR
mgnify:CR=1 FL=1